jgi:hypothetical protein
MLTRDNPTLAETTQQSITAASIFEQFERLSLELRRLTVMVIDNAKVHLARVIKGRISVATTRFVSILPAAIFAAPEPGRAALAEVEIRMAHAERL